MRRHVRNPALAKWFDKPTLRLRRTFHIDRTGQLGRSVEFVQLDRPFEFERLECAHLDFIEEVLEVKLVCSRCSASISLILKDLMEKETEIADLMGGTWYNSRVRLSNSSKG